MNQMNKSIGSGNNYIVKNMYNGNYCHVNN